MAAKRSKRTSGAVVVGVVVVAAGVAVAVPAVAGGRHQEEAKKPTLASLSKQLASLRSKEATLSGRVTALRSRGSLPGPVGSAGPVGPAGPAGPPGGTDAYTRAESDARFVHGSAVETLVRIEVPPSATAPLADLGPLGRLEGTCGPLSTPPGAILQPPASQTGAIDVIADTGVVDAMGHPSLVLQTIDPASPAPVNLPGTGQAYHALVHVAQGVSPGARLAALDVTGFKAAAGALPCRFTVRLTSTGG
jgi:hypothetical protein